MTVTVLGMTSESITERSQSIFRFTREQFWYKLLCYEVVNPKIKIILSTSRFPFV